MNEYLQQKHLPPAKFETTHGVEGGFCCCVTVLGTNQNPAKFSSAGKHSKKKQAEEGAALVAIQALVPSSQSDTVEDHLSSAASQVQSQVAPLQSLHMMHGLMVECAGAATALWKVCQVQIE